MPLSCFGTGSLTLVPCVRAGRFGRRGVWIARRRVYEAAHRESPASRCVRAAIRSRARTPKWYTGAVPLPGAGTLALNRSRTRALKCCTYAVALVHVTPGQSCRQSGHRLRQRIIADQMPMVSVVANAHAPHMAPRVNRPICGIQEVASGTSLLSSKLLETLLFDTLWAVHV